VRPIRLALCQLDPLVGDVAGNRDKVGRAAAEAREKGADVAIFSELVLTGYPPKDLLERPAFISENLEARDALARETSERFAIVLGFADRRAAHTGRRLHNAAALLAGGAVRSVHHKRLLPTYDVFDEHRWFEPAHSVAPATLGDRKLGITVCEDIWNDPDFWPERLYPDDPLETLALAGAELLINVSASPFTLPKRHLRPKMLAGAAARHKRPLVFVNQVGGNDELVFDGASAVYDSDGRVLARAHELAEDMVLCDLPGGGTIRDDAGDDDAAAYEALVLGLADYVAKCGFESVVVGVSGGIDSALTACIAADALGPSRVLCVSMPSPYSSEGSIEDARALAHAIGARFVVVPIQETFDALRRTLAPTFAELPEDVTEENEQARIRALLLMAISNKLGPLLLTTGNKSELAVGYCTLYGDMCGGLAVISDVPKTMVYRLARHANARRRRIPEATFTKPPSAELRPDQLDQDSLPPYDILDRVLESYVERGLTPEEIVSEGALPEVVAKVVRLVERSEYKRAQAAPGIIITSKAFGPGRRMPIARGGW
jgi:NAD+ synthetase